MSEQGPQTERATGSSFRRVFWPDVYDAASAQSTARYGAYTAWFMAASIVVLGILAIWTGKDPAGEIVAFSDTSGWVIYVATNVALIGLLYQ